MTERALTLCVSHEDFFNVHETSQSHVILLRVKPTYSLVSSVFLSIVDAIIKTWRPAGSRVALLEDGSPDAAHLLPLPMGRLSHAAL